MTSSSSTAPAFGQADLSNCEREQIQLAGSIQPHGALLVIQEPDHAVVQASDNASDFLGIDGPLIGRSLRDLGGTLGKRIYPHLTDSLNTIPMAVRCQLGDPASEFDCLIHRPGTDTIVIELERAGSRVDLSKSVGQALRKVLVASSLRALCDESAQVFKELVDYDRVMIYRFDEQGHGEVFSECRNPDLEPFLGNRYPASDIPQIARELYMRNRVRLIYDVNYEPIPISPRLSPATGKDLDMSLCFLRSMSPIHVQYLKNMGVSGTLVASLVVGGKLWGLVSCHHYQPRFLHYEMRATCELLAEFIATRIAALESFVQGQADLTVRRLEHRMIDAISRDGDWKSALFEHPDTLLQPLHASGAALLFEGRVHTTGDVPSTYDLRKIGRWLDERERTPVSATDSLIGDDGQFESIRQVAGGLLAVPVSVSPGEYLVWFRPERVRTVTWGGDPNKPVLIGNDPTDLSPRRSFAQWHEVVKGTCDPWTAADMRAGRLIGETVADVVLQFQSVRLLIAQNQLEVVSRQVQTSELPVVVADGSGKLLMTNQAFEDLLPSVHASLNNLDDLPALFAEPDLIRRSLRDLVNHRRPWRGQVRLASVVDSENSLLIRADPIYSSPDAVLGFVFLFSDMAERTAAESARQNFQERIIEHRRVMTAQLDTKADLVYRDLLTSVVENAQLAALEITDGSDLSQVPGMLEGIRTSVTRTSELLEHLIWHATRETDTDC